jgi:putative salt-induced outer membrane protein YdiY
MERGMGKSHNVLIRLVWLCVISCCLLVVNIIAHAAQQNDQTVKSETESKDQKMQSQPWEPPPPPPDDFDWIQLKSGEWLKGELKVLYEKKLEFDSDELELLKFDWEDVKQVRGHRIFSVRFVGPITVDGLLQVTEDKVFVTVGEERQEFERNKLVAIAPGEPREINYWSANLNVGLNYASGNTQQTQYSAIANIKRRTSATRFVTDYLGNFTKTEGVQTVNNQRLNTYFDIFKTRKYFFRPIFAEYYRDPFKNISSRVTVGAGMGYHIIDTSKTEWDVAGGPAYQRTRFDSVQAGEASSESTPAFVAGTHFERELTETVDFDLLYDIQIVNKKSGTYSHHFVAAVETELTDWLDFDVSFVWDRTKDPQPNADGTVPKQDDLYVIISLGIEF